MGSLIKVLEQYTKSNGIKFTSCPSCGQKGLYKVRWRFDRCRYCGLYRILLPDQDF